VNKDYSPDQLLSICKVQHPFSADQDKAAVTKILAAVATANSPQELIDLITKAIQELHSVSIGMALDHLFSVSNIGKEFQGDADGIDALCYHLSGFQCSKAIVALSAVQQRFQDTYKAE